MCSLSISVSVGPGHVDLSYPPARCSNAASTSRTPDDRRTEIAAGVTTFLTMAYIIFVQPAVLSAAGMDFGAVLAATCLASGIGDAADGGARELSDRRRAGDGPQLLLRLHGRRRRCRCRGRSRSARSRSPGSSSSSPPASACASS